MEIWAKTYGWEKGMASRVKAGQAGDALFKKHCIRTGSPLPPLPEDLWHAPLQLPQTTLNPLRKTSVNEDKMPVLGDSSEVRLKSLGSTLVCKSTYWITDHKIYGDQCPR
jgi:hypothetical protein